jgi:DNA-binding MarR family transcriptional regulator
MPERDRRDIEDESQALLMAVFRMVRLLRSQGPREVVDVAAMFVLQAVAANPGIRVSELADLVGLDASTLSRLTRNLEQSGYLDRRPDPRDGRATQWRISDHGEAEMTRALQRRTTMIAQTLEGWPATQRARLVELNERFVADFEKT